MHGDIKTASIEQLMNLIFNSDQLALESVKNSPRRLDDHSKYNYQKEELSL
jgi:hypothetical protein